ncbi:SPFH domain-containing protein [uncultured Enorma sp.]|uniref:SPFH domain-containing protein n=1 Tax=uncultured Enorma sp. TaxID=1714346 RepID=UPI00259619B5|nr:SPFH domain-containing protein [uncultured Enorma sp.]
MSVEKKIKAASGWGVLIGVLVAFVIIIAAFVLSIISIATADEAGLPISPLAGWGLGLSITAFCLIWIPVSGFFTLQPGQARVCILFGNYKGTVRDEGFRWANPFYSRSMGGSSSSEEATAEVLSKSGLSLGKQISAASKAASGLSTKISVRARTLNGEILKVNDKMGNPIEIANVVVWHVADTAKALFDVDNYEQYVATQAETALRHVASIYAYDHAEDSSDSMDSITLRSNIEEVSTALKHELTQRLAPAGVAVDDARLTHLAYAPEIAQAMLRRQQAEAVIAARKKIVEGAVTMVEMAVDELGTHGKIELDDERKAQMASNLMVVLCGESEAHPIVNAGSLY